jgi:putative ABC transport system substrate-binding protein
MRRREFLTGFTAAVWPLVGSALPALGQTPNRVYRLGHLANSADSEGFTRQTTLPELARLGFVEGRNLVFDARDGEPDVLPDLMRELLATRPDAVVAVGPGWRPLRGRTFIRGRSPQPSQPAFRRPSSMWACSCGRNQGGRSRT